MQFSVFGDHGLGYEQLVLHQIIRPLHLIHLQDWVGGGQTRTAVGKGEWIGRALCRSQYRRVKNYLRRVNMA